ncbi:MAG: hypothetical protein K2N82_01305 [Lachnospiraceae bacterium]|nr:hypothetical protein [Lachnospiraceae bacterium]
MKQAVKAVKIVMTILFSVFCCFAMLLGGVYYFATKDSVAYDVKSMAMPQIKDVQAEVIGDTYQGEDREGTTYYKLFIVLENPSNSLQESNDYYFNYMDRTGEYNGGVWEMSNGHYDSNVGLNVLPADTTGVITKVVRVDNGCEDFLLVISNHLAKEKQSFLVKL